MFPIPAIDVIEGKCVRLEQGAYDRQTTYFDDPLEVAKRYEDHGIERLHLVDLEGAKASRVINWKVLEQCCTLTSLQIDFGGGIKQEDDLRIVFECGAAQATVGSIAAEQPDTFLLWLERFGAGRLILGADLKDGKVATRGWLESTDDDWQSFVSGFVSHGVQYVVCTDIQKDGMMQGPSFDLYEKFISAFPETKLIASGGISSIDDMYPPPRNGVLWSHHR